MKMQYRVLGTMTYLGLLASLVTAQAQGVIKIGEINSYTAQPAFLEPITRAGSWRWRKSTPPAVSTARRSK